MSKAAGKFKMSRVESYKLHAMLDPNAAMVEMSISAEVLSNGKSYDQSYVISYECEDGKLKHYREYWNPLVLVDAMGGAGAWAAGFGKPL